MTPTGFGLVIDTMTDTELRTLIHQREERLSRLSGDRALLRGLVDDLNHRIYTIDTQSKANRGELAMLYTRLKGLYEPDTREGSTP